MYRFATKPLFLLIFAIGCALAASANASPAVAGGNACHRAPAEKEGNGTLVEMIANCFTPIVLRVDAGEAVVFRNNDQMDHVVAGVAQTWATSADKPMKVGETATFTFAEGTYPYSCSLHVGMSGVIVAGSGSSSSASLVRESVPVQRSTYLAPDTAVGAPAAALAAAPTESGEGNELVFAGLGALAGAVAVLLGVGARGLRKP